MGYVGYMIFGANIRYGIINDVQPIYTNNQNYLRHWWRRKVEFCQRKKWTEFPKFYFEVDGVIWATLKRTSIISRETFPKLTQGWGMSAKTLVCTKPCEGCQSNHGMLNENIASASLEVAARSLHEASEEWRPWWWWKWPLARLWGHAKKAAGGLRANGQSPFLYAPIASCYQPQGSLTHLGFLSS